MKGMQTKWLNTLPEPLFWDLQRMQRLVRSAGIDLNKLNVIHVGGTNGKGSVCAFLEAILRSEGYSVGLYTSPHLLDVRERIQFGGKMISRKDFARLAKWAKPLVEKEKASYFETLTLMALQYFLEKKVQWAIIEVGLGGRLDATNVVQPKVCIITNVELEHTDRLGQTLEKIAYEKAGIIKPNAWSTVTAAKGKALEVIQKKAEDNRVSCIVAKPTRQDKAYAKKASLQGAFQLENVSVVLRVIQSLQNHGIKISEKAIREGLKRTYWPGRFQRIGNVIVDGAHNPAGVEALLKSLPHAKNLVFGVLKDKDYKRMVSLLSGRFENVFLVAPSSPRALDAKALQREFEMQGVCARICPNVREALRQCHGKTLVCGSLYLVAEAFETLLVNQKGNGAVTEKKFTEYKKKKRVQRRKL